MAALPLSRLWPVTLFMATLAFLLAIGNLEGSSEAAVKMQDVRQQLQGSWLREGVAAGMRVSHRLVLRGSGTFYELVHMTDEAGHVTEYRHEGTWLYDGTNLKRKYTMFNGKPPSRLNVPFATFEIRFTTPNEFVGVDHVYGNRIEYRRVGNDE